MLEDEELWFSTWNSDTNLTRSHNDRISHQFLGKRTLEFIRARWDTPVLQFERQWRPLSEFQLLENTKSLFCLINGLSAPILIIHNGLHQPLKLPLQLYGLLHHHPWIRFQHPWLRHLMMMMIPMDQTPKPSTLQQPQKLICVKNWKFGSENGEAENISCSTPCVSSSLLSFSLHLRISLLFKTKEICVSEWISLSLSLLLLFCCLLFSVTFNHGEENKDFTIKTQTHNSTPP